MFGLSLLIVAIWCAAFGPLLVDIGLFSIVIFVVTFLFVYGLMLRLHKKRVDEATKQNFFNEFVAEAYGKPLAWEYTKGCPYHIRPIYIKTYQMGDSTFRDQFGVKWEICNGFDGTRGHWIILEQDKGDLL